MPERVSGGVRDVGGSFVQWLPTIGLALLILVGGFLLAYVLKAITYSALKRTNLDNRMARFFGTRSGAGADPHRTERWLSKAVFYTVIAFVLVAFFAQLRIAAVTEPIVRALSGITAAIPNLIKALVIGVIGYLIAKLARRGVVALVDRTGLSERLARMDLEGAGARGFRTQAGGIGTPEDIGMTDTDPLGGAPRSQGRFGAAAARAGERNALGESKLAAALGDVAYWIVIAITAIPVLEALKIGVLAAPLSAVFAGIALYLPRIAAAALLLAIGYVAGRLLRALTTALMERIGVDRLVARLGGTRVLKGQNVSGIIGSIVMAFVILHFAISAVGRLGIPEISLPLGLFLSMIYGYLPKLFVGGFIIAIGIVVARLAGNLAARLLAAMGFNTLMSHIGIYKSVAPAARAQEVEAKTMLQARMQGERSESEVGEDRLFSKVTGGGVTTARTPADFGGLFVALVVGVVFVRQALSTMHLASFANMLDKVLAFVPNLFVAAVILAVAFWAGGKAHSRLDELTMTSTDRLTRYMGKIAHVAIVTFGVMAAAQQLGVASSLIGIAFALVLGALCLAGALAFGLGSRDVAGEIVRREYEKRGRGRPPPGGMSPGGIYPPGPLTDR